jgi:hypothetical protein
MNETTIVLTLGEGRCIECAAKHEYNMQVMRIMTSEGPPGPDDEARLDLLVEFLENADFAALRSSGEALDGTKNSRCLLKRSADGKPRVSVVDL